MKKLLVFAVVALFATSCQKNVSVKTVALENRLYKVTETDFDSLTMTTPIVKSAIIVPTAIADVLQVNDDGNHDGGDDEHGDNDFQKHCKEHKEDNKCKATPVVWTSFTVERKTDFNLLTWTVGFEINVKVYTIYRSDNEGKTFHAIGTVIPNGTGIYTFNDYLNEIK